MIEDIKHIAMVRFLRKYSDDDLFVRWKDFPLTQEFIRSVVYPLFQDIQKLKKRILIEPLAESIFEPPIELKIEDSGDEKEKCPYCLRYVKKGFGMKMHVSKNHKEKFDEWKREHGQ